MTRPQWPITTPGAQTNAASPDTNHLDLYGYDLDPAQVWRAARALAGDLNASSATPRVGFTTGARQAIADAHSFIQQLVLEDDQAYYGINTGFGILAEVRVPADKLAELQLNLVRSHACGVGEDLPRDLVACMMLLRLNVAARGHSGLSPNATELILAFLGRGLIPCVPSRGSVGASGDLAPLAHMALPLIGEGSCTVPMEGGGLRRLSGAEALSLLDRQAHVLGPKEGLALVNGTSLTTSLAIRAWYEARDLVEIANLATAMTAVATASNLPDGSELAYRAHGHPATLSTARRIRTLAAGTTERDELGLARRQQDPYSLRCAPLVHGCVQHELQQCEEILVHEINSSADNPLVFPEEGEVVSCGNFHALYPGRTADRIASALVTLATISERRSNFLMDGAATGLPTFLTDDPGLKSGLMMAHVTAAALTAEAKSLAFPATVDTIPTNCDREDHVSMGPGAGFKALEIVWRVRRVLAIELIAAAQALNLTGLHEGRPWIATALAALRETVPVLTEDRVLGRDIENLALRLEGGPEALLTSEVDVGSSHSASCSDAGRTTL